MASAPSQLGAFAHSNSHKAGHGCNINILDSDTKGEEYVYDNSRPNLQYHVSITIVFILIN